MDKLFKNHTQDSFNMWIAALAKFEQFLCIATQNLDAFVFRIIDIITESFLCWSNRMIPSQHLMFDKSIVRTMACILKFVDKCNQKQDKKTTNIKKIVMRAFRASLTLSRHIKDKLSTNVAHFLGISFRWLVFDDDEVKDSAISNIMEYSKCFLIPQDQDKLSQVASKLISTEMLNLKQKQLLSFWIERMKRSDSLGRTKEPVHFVPIQALRKDRELYSMTNKNNMISSKPNSNSRSALFTQLRNDTLSQSRLRLEPAKRKLDDVDLSAIINGDGSDGESSVEKQKRSTKLLETPELTKRPKSQNSVSLTNSKVDPAFLIKRVLEWNFKTLQEKDVVDISKIKEMPDEFKSHEEYVDAFKPLILLECSSQLMRFNQENYDVNETKIKMLQVLMVDELHGIFYMG